MEHDPLLANAFGQILRTRREAAGLTQATLASKVGLSDSYLQFLEYGKRQPTLSTFLQVADALDLDPAELLQDTIRLLTTMRGRKEP